MKIGVFVPIGNNGWLISTHAPQYMPTFELNKAIVQKAEHYHFDFALSMIKLRGFGGKTEFWDHNLESFTLMAGLADTERVVESNGYTLHIHLTETEVWVESSDCPTQDCVRTGHISRGGQSIVCLPARVIVALEGGPAAESGVDAVIG